MLQELMIITAAIAAPPEVWPAFLGQGASPIDPVTIPLTWSPTENIAWQTKLPGKGQSSPVIWNDRIFVTAIEGTMKEKCHLLGLSLQDGRKLWCRTNASAQTVRSTYTQSRAAPTPVVDADRVYAFFETGNVIAADHAGNIVWQRILTEDYGPFESTIGLASSPILVDGILVILVDHEGPSYILGLDAKTGETRWKTERTSRSSYASPALVPVAGEPHIVCSSSGSVDGYDPKTGDMLWTYEENIGGNRTGAPLPIRDGMFAVGASPGMHNEREAEARKSNFVMRVDRIDGKFVPKVVWRTEEAMPSYNSPVVLGDFAYWVNRAGVVFCYDAETGKNLYTKRSGGTCWVTPVRLGDRVYLFGKDGTTTVLALGPEHQVLAENSLWDPEKVGRDAGPRGNSSGGGAPGGHQGHGEQPGAVEKASPRAPADAPTRSGPPPASEKAPTVESPVRPGSTEAGQPSPPTSRSGRPAVEGPGSGRPAMTDQEREESRARNAGRFADPVQYGVAIVNGSLVIRTGDIVYCVRATAATPAVK